MPQPDTRSAGGASSRGPHRLADTVCERLWRYRHVEHLQPRHDPPWRLIGTGFHLCVAYYWASLMPDPPAWFRATRLAEALDDAVGHERGLVRRVTDMFGAWRRYIAAYPREPVAVEEEFSLTLDTAPYGEVVTARVDLVARENGHLWAYDMKTSARGGWGSDGAAERLPRWNDEGPFALDWQSLVVLRAVRARYGADKVRGFIVDRAKQTEPFDFDSHLVHINPVAYDDAPQTAQLACDAERRYSERAKADVPAVGSFWACHPYGRACEYRSLCLVAPDARARVAVVDYRIVRPAKVLV